LAYRYSFSPLFFILLVLSGPQASADWAVAGAQYSCAEESGTFTLLPYVVSSEDENPPVKQGFAVVSGDDPSITCSLRERMLEIQIVVIPPQARGECMGAGMVDVRSLAVDGVEFLERRQAFDWGCSNAPALTKITARFEASLVEFERCLTNSEFSQESPGEVNCSTKSFDVDALGAAQAAIDHRIDDVAVQAERSATRLPTDNDLALVYARRFPADSEIPICAHWFATFINAIVNPEGQRHGRVAGVEGERVAVRPTNPQLCGVYGGENCEATAYLMAGDRVDVGFICGVWTPIQRRSRVLSEPPIRGWVETARLYDVDPMTEGTAVDPVGMTVVPSTDIDATFLAAIVAKDYDGVRRLVAAGTDPNGLQRLGSPLANAIELRDIEMVRTLIELGADVNAHGSQCRILDVALRDEEIFYLLVGEGLDVDCLSGGSTALMRIAAFRRLLVWEWLRESGRPAVEHLRDLAAVARRLVLAGADVNTTDRDGRTALFYVADAINVDVAQALLDLGADPNISIGGRADSSLGQQLGSTPLMRAMISPALFETLLQGGADPNYRDPSRYNEEWDLTTSGAVTFAGQTVLTRAASDGRLTIARLALEHGADPLVPRQDGALPEAIARLRGHPEVAALIASYASQTGAATGAPDVPR
jgi:ankyrin repeat protein